MRPVASAFVVWAAVVSCAVLMQPAAAPAAQFLEFVDPHPAAGNGFGTVVLPLRTGRVVITSPGDDAGGADAGAAYLFDGWTGALISTLVGGSAGDRIGSGGVVALANGNYVIASPSWHDVSSGEAGAVTWGSGMSGVGGAVSEANSLVGEGWSHVGGGGVTALSNGNYVVRSPGWSHDALAWVGAATWGSGVGGVSGRVSAANSLVGSTDGDSVSNYGVTELTNGNYVVASRNWHNGASALAGAATWGSGATGVSGVVSATNSLVGSTFGDGVGQNVVALSNGNYVVGSPAWSNGAMHGVGAVTWGSGTSGVHGVVSLANSLIGGWPGDYLGYRGSLLGGGQIYGVTALPNGNYVVASPFWDLADLTDAGAVTWGSGTTGVTGTVSAANSLVGSSPWDAIGSLGATPLANGNYVVASPGWDNGAIVDAGAATWCSGSSGLSGALSSANSLVGSSPGDFIGSTGVTPLANGNYVVVSPGWDRGGKADAGAVTWGSGTSGVRGVVSVTNSLVGFTAGDAVGSFVTALSNGNYVVASNQWNDGSATRAGAVTWGSGTGGVTGFISAVNSLIGSRELDQVGVDVRPLSNGNYVVTSPYWHTPDGVEVGAVTWGSGTSGAHGLIGTGNSLIGSTAGDRIGLSMSSSGAVTELANGNYVVVSSWWNGGLAVDAGAVTWGSGTSGVTGVVSASNSLVGCAPNDQLGSGGVTPLSNGNYVVVSPECDNGVIADAGVATWGSGTLGVTGVVATVSSVIGGASSVALRRALDDRMNGSFICPTPAEGAGRVRVGPFDPPAISSIVDIPNDQGDWLRLTFRRGTQDRWDSPLVISTYGVWRRLPGTFASIAARRTPGAAPASVDPTGRRLRAILPSALGAFESEGRLFVVATESRLPGMAASFPAGIWELLTSVPAMQRASYLVAVPTVSNAAPNDFVVTAHTTTAAIWYVSDPVSGQSVDNLAPAQPTQFTAAYAGGATHLEWVANTEDDLGAYALYRGQSADFVPSPGNRIASPTTTHYADEGSAGHYYKLSAVDVNGNESSFALVTPGQTGEVPTAPAVFALDRVRPNPASGADLRVAFSLPDGAPARLDVLDVNGRSVAAREVGGLGPGRHAVNLAERRRLSPGVYWVRLSQGRRVACTRIAVLD